MEPDDALVAAARAHPNDPALARALAAAQLERGDADGALETLRDHTARNPEQRAALAQLFGRTHYAKGELALAKSALEEAVAHRERDALAHLYLGLTLLRLGERDAAASELVRAEQLDARLAERVRSAARREDNAWQRALARFVFAGGTGLEYDTNSTLEGNEDITNLPGDPADARLVYNVAIGARLLRNEHADLSAGYRLDDSRHQDLDSLDLQSHAAWLGGTFALAPRWFARAESGAALHRLDHSTFLRSASFGSGIGLASERRGTFELRAHAERRGYENAPTEPFLERDGWRFGGTLRHALPVSLWQPALITTQLAYARTLTEGERADFDLGVGVDPSFGPAFDSHFGAFDVALRAPLPSEFRIEARLGFGAEHFDEPNVIDFISDNGVGDLDPERRLDYAVDASLSITRPLSRWLELELRARESRHFSNVDVYDWNRQIVGSYLRLRWQSR